MCIRDRGIDGVILTKLDGDTRGGAALSVRAVTGKPIKFAGTGEKIEEIEAFHPERMASRILGMGDVLSLIERAESQLDVKKAEQMARRLTENKMDYNDMLDQFAQVRKLGPIKQILSSLPGMDKHLKEADIDDSQMDKQMDLSLIHISSSPAAPSATRKASTLPTRRVSPWSLPACAILSTKLYFLPKGRNPNGYLNGRRRRAGARPHPQA